MWRAGEGEDEPLEQTDSETAHDLGVPEIGLAGLTYI
jgi:hypothetical protein